MQSTFGTKCLRNGGNMGELMQQYIDEAEQDLLHTYNRYQVVLDRGDGVSLYDIEGNGIWILWLVLRCLPSAIIMPSTMMR